ncbi:MAG: tetratricopeptide repeat-containing serine protease family protein [Calothrix sp. MO_167.B12]|nr:tetratricopeptide repeat-containing serine protease family protein [Calothrix sp. MO_167.B12]
MKFHHPLSPAIVGAAMVLMVPQVATALSSTEIGKIAEDITVLIKSEASGSGVIINKSGKTYTVLTAYHVVANKKPSYKIFTPDGESYVLKKKTIKQLSNLDLAVVEFTSNKNYKVANIGNSDKIKRGNKCYLGGFPQLNAAFRKPIFTFTSGEINASSSQTLSDDGYALVYNNDTVGGMSGGPILNEKGELIGIHGRADSRYDERTEQATVSNFKLGIPINTFVQLAGKNRVDVGVAASTPKVVTALKAEDFFVKGVNKSRKRDYQGAITDLNQAISHDSTYAEAFFQRGYARNYLQNYQGAADDYTLAIKFKPKYTEAHNNRGNTRYELKDYRRAIEDYTQAIKINPNYATAYFGRSAARAKINDLRGAMEDKILALKLIKQRLDVITEKLNRLEK